MMYIVLDPRSNSNKSGMFIVVWFQDWIDYVNWQKESYDFKRFKTYEMAAYAAKMANTRKGVTVTQIGHRK